MPKRFLLGILCGALLAVVASAQTAGTQPLPGLDVTVTKVERAATASLRDCPPGSNTGLHSKVTRNASRFISIRA